MTAMEKLIECRTRRGWNQTQLSTKSGVDQSTISKFESGMGMGRLAATKIATLLGFEVSVYELMFPNGLPEVTLPISEPGKVA